MFYILFKILYYKVLKLCMFFNKRFFTAQYKTTVVHCVLYLFILLSLQVRLKKSTNPLFVLSECIILIVFNLFIQALTAVNDF